CSDLGASPEKRRRAIGLPSETPPSARRMQNQYRPHRSHSPTKLPKSRTAPPTATSRPPKNRPGADKQVLPEVAITYHYYPTANDENIRLAQRVSTISTPATALMAPAICGDTWKRPSSLNSISVCISRRNTSAMSPLPACPAGGESRRAIDSSGLVSRKKIRRPFWVLAAASSSAS